MEKSKETPLSEFGLLKRKVHSLHAKDIHKIIKVARELTQYAKAKL